MPKYIDKLTPEQESRFGEWTDKWIKIGLQTGDADFETFDKYIKVAYEKANLEFPPVIVRVKSPLVGAVASSLAMAILNNELLKSKKQTGEAFDNVNLHAEITPELKQDIHDATIEALSPYLEDGENLNNLMPPLSSIDWHYWLGGQFWVGDWYGSPSFVSFFTDVCDLELEPDIEERATAYRRICESVNYIWCNSHFVMVCDRPQVIKRNEAGQLHCENGKAISYKDGWGLFVLDGTTIKEESLFRQIVSGKMWLGEIMAIENADIRAIALKYNPLAMLESGAKLIDKSDRGNELYLIEKTDLNEFLEEPEIYMLKMECPTRRTFVEGVPPDYAKANPNADKCQAHLLGIDDWQYKNLRVEG